MDYDNYNEHFLDSNIIIGKILEWDHSNFACCEYIEKPINKNTSPTVYKECKRVFSRNKLIQKDFLNELNTFLEDEGINDFNRQLSSFKNNYITNKHSSFHLSKIKFENIVNGFVRDCYDRIHSSMQNYFDYIQFLGDIDEAFKKAAQELNFICYGRTLQIQIHTCPLSYEPHLLDKLGSWEIHDPDSTIILDCHHVQTNNIHEDVAFITSDGDIIDAKTNIETMLSGIYICGLN